MPSLTFIEPSGASRTVEAKVGDTAMQAATRAGVDGILGDCGGSCICATCHCYVDDAWTQRVGPASGAEADTLEFGAEAVRPESRLACQITITADLDGLVLKVAREGR